MRQLLLFITLSMLGISATAVADTVFKGSPFTDVIYEGGHVKVQHENEFYYLISIDDVPTENILSACEAVSSDCQKLFAENFAELLSGLDLPSTDWKQEGALRQVDLGLYYFPTHRMTVFEDVDVTPENQQEVIRNRRLRGE